MVLQELVGTELTITLGFHMLQAKVILLLPLTDWDLEILVALMVSSSSRLLLRLRVRKTSLPRIFNRSNSLRHSL